jgi:uncharacterized protein YndB with AHSA1/START domain
VNPTPTGQIVSTTEGRDLVLVRTFRAPMEDVWASITDPERTARWFGPWSGDAGPGKKIKYTMSFEQGDAWSEMTIEVCEPPRHLAVTSVDNYGRWHLEAQLSERDDVTELRFVQHLAPEVNVGDVGPGWEYYLDNLVAYREEKERPKWDDYYPSQKEYYLAL